MRVAVVGLGTGGPAAALFLARQGHEVEIFERVTDPGPVGAGLLLQPTGMAVLDRLGLLEGVLARSARVDRLRGVTTYGRTVIDLAYSDLRPGLFGLGVHRGTLFQALEDAVHAAGIPVREGVSVDTLPSGYDLVVIAAGARSTLRPPGAVVRPYPWGALWTSIPDPTGRWDGVLSQVYRDTRQMLGFLPSGTPPGHSTPQVSLFWSIRTDAMDAWRARGLDAWKADILALAPDVPVDAMTPPTFAPYFDVRMYPYQHGNVVWIGDAAHAMSPQLGQGANLALIDAMTLADCVAEGRLDEYSARRRDHVGFYAWASRWLTPFFQSSFPVLAPPRDLVAMPLHAWPWYRRQMLASLAGMKTGIFSELPPLLTVQETALAR
ncbi:MAG: NAD(P)/FAD-dependent oxidoreductase [Pseudomonadota bacterium]|nr:NAD(P)/FAD-dependent oxidoreductase [Pseudomonadota bacterium]